MSRVTLEEEVAEQTVCRFTGVLVDETGEPVPAADLTAMTLTLYNDDRVKQVINGMLNSNILNDAYRGTVDANGNFTLTLYDADNSILNSERVRETHVALVRFTYSSGTKTGRQEIAFQVVNLDKVS